MEIIMMENFKLRCRRCRFVVITHEEIVNTHSQPLQGTETSCSSSSTNSVWYVSMDTDQCPWIQECVSQASWTKGKLSCPKCHGRIGSFDFVSSLQCPCGKQSLPGVHILRDRVDQIKSVSAPLVTQVKYNNAVKPTELTLLTHASSHHGSLDGSKSTELSVHNIHVKLQDVPLGEQPSLWNLDDDIQTVPAKKQSCSTECGSADTGATVRHSCKDNGISNTDLQKEKHSRRKLRRRRRPLDLDRDLENVNLSVEMNRFHLLPEEEIPSDDDVTEDILDEHVCPVCLDVYFHPHVCRPCGHMFCESCLRQLAQKSDNSTSFPCPLCRDLIMSCRLEKELTCELKILYPESYKYRLMTDRKYLSHRFPLPQSTDRHKHRALSDHIVYSFSNYNFRQLSRMSVKGVTLLGVVMFLVLVLCVSLVL